MNDFKEKVLMGDVSGYAIKRALSPKDIETIDDRVAELVFNLDNIITYNNGSGLLLRHPIHPKEDSTDIKLSWRDILVETLTQEDRETIESVLYWYTIDEVARQSK